MSELRQSYAKTVHDKLSFSGGRTIADVSDSELANACTAAGIPDAHYNGRAANAEAFAKHLAAIGAKASDDAVMAWLKDNAR